MINQHKRIDVFRCNLEAHRDFSGKVSVHHVLREKACFPQGCLYFLWKCVLLEKGRNCIHRYGHAGKKCKGCTYFVDEKVNLQPTLLLDSADYERFLIELDEYETWFEHIRIKRQNIMGRISAVKPWFEKTVRRGESHTRLWGYILLFKKGYIGTDHFEDAFYVRVSENLMQAFHFVPKMKIELTGEIRQDRGRIVVMHPGKVEILSKGWGVPWTRERALVAVRTATDFKKQPESCLACPWGALADIMDLSDCEERRFRNLYCLKGIADPESCYVRREGAIRSK